MLNLSSCQPARYASNFLDKGGFIVISNGLYSWDSVTIVRKVCICNDAWNHTCLSDKISIKSLSLSRWAVSIWNLSLRNSSVTAAVLFCQWLLEYSLHSPSLWSTEESRSSSRRIILLEISRSIFRATISSECRVLSVEDLRLSHKRCHWANSVASCQQMSQVDLISSINQRLYF